MRRYSSRHGDFLGCSGFPDCRAAWTASGGRLPGHSRSVGLHHPPGGLRGGPGADVPTWVWVVAAIVLLVVLSRLL